MNKLTEIKRKREKLKKLTGLPKIAERDWLNSKSGDDIDYLLSLLEEKDAALKFYADEENNKPTHPTIGYMKYVSTVQLDSGMIARKALNTSSNNEGE